MMESALGRWRELGIVRRKALESALGRWLQLGIARRQML